MYTYGDIHTHVQLDGYAWLSMYFLGDSGIRFLVFTVVLGRLKGPDISVSNIHVPPYRQNKWDESNEKTFKWKKK